MLDHLLAVSVRAKSHEQGKRNLENPNRIKWVTMGIFGGVVRGIDTATVGQVCTLGNVPCEQYRTDLRHKFKFFKPGHKILAALVF